MMVTKDFRENYIILDRRNISFIVTYLLNYNFLEAHRNLIIFHNSKDFRQFFDYASKLTLFKSKAASAYTGSRLLYSWQTADDDKRAMGWAASYKNKSIYEAVALRKPQQTVDDSEK